jgi:hypothetical protein
MNFQEHVNEYTKQNPAPACLMLKKAWVRNSTIDRRMASCHSERAMPHIVRSVVRGAES